MLITLYLASKNKIIIRLNSKINLFNIFLIFFF